METPQSASGDGGLGSIAAIAEKRRQEFKSRGESDQGKRRAEVLKQQRQSRRSLVSEHFRNLVEHQDDDEKDGSSGAANDGEKGVLKLMTTLSRKRHLERDGDAATATSAMTFGEMQLAKSRDKQEDDVTVSMAEPESKLRRTSEYEEEDESTAQTKNKVEQMLMIPEHMSEIPNDLFSNWLLLAIPRGIRCVVIATRRKTISRGLDGSVLHRFHSVLPGGGHRDSSAHNIYTILDCVYSPERQTYYVLDLMCWKGFEHYDCDTAFRFYWVATKLGEVNSAHRDAKLNPFPFVFLTPLECNISNLVSAYQTHAHGGELAGFWFYNKETHYHLGVTPLVCYLETPELPSFIQTVTAAAPSLLSVIV